ncbi:MAG: trypsin-like peptidase domain-containing protein [Verrucomicrobiales bacterium]|nr:trypsin-like peptidase domain-containing protein [Verrucomicrobiales bacterium]
MTPLLLTFLSAIDLAAGQNSDPPEDEKTTSLGKQYEGIVRVECASIIPDYRTPWNPGLPSGGSGTAFLIGPNLFLTNAHVVSNANRIIIKKVGDAQPYPARIRHIAHDCDLALLELRKPDAFNDVTPMEIGTEIPKLDTTVKVVGYPVGGERISVTRGVVSRIDFVAYSHSGVDHHLAIQIDAAINPGNSGGPVGQGGKVVGVAFQGYSGNVAQNVGYMIPVPVIRRFLKDVEDGKYDHYVDLVATDFPILNPAQRKALGLPDDGRGIMVATVNSQGSAGGVLQTGDVLLEIDGKAIASNGFIDLGGEQVDMSEIVERKFAGEKVKVKVWRERQALDLEMELKPFTAYLMNARQYERRPEYVTFCGLVFQPLDLDVMMAHNISKPRVRYYFNYYSTNEIFKERPQVILLTQVLPDSINTHLRDYVHTVVEEINGVKIKTLRDVKTALEKPVEGDHVRILLEGEGRPIVIEKGRIAAAQQRIMEQYDVKHDSYIAE